MDLNQLENTGFGLVEYVFGREPEMEGAHPGTPEPAIRMTGISVSSETVEDGKLLAAIERASVLHASYVVIETGSLSIVGVGFVKIPPQFYEKGPFYV